MTWRFFVPSEWLTGQTAHLKGEASHRIRNVLRLKQGDTITLLDGLGWEFEAEITSLGAVVEARLGEKRLCSSEPQAKVSLYASLLKGDKFDFVLQKATELGVARICPTLSSRCVAGEPGTTKLERWQAIIREAAEQSRRGSLPVLHPVVRFEQACRNASGVGLIPWEGEKALGLKAALPPSALAVSIFIGPEGGYSTGEIESALSAGVVPVSLGPRILRAETAAIAVLAAVMFHLGEMGVRDQTSK